MASPGFSSPPSHATRKTRTALVLVGLTCLALVVFSRSPDLLLTARFFAEDGQIFYQQAHELGFVHSILLPYAGYLHLFPRLVAGLSLWLPLFYVPLFFNVVALTVHCLTAVYICSPRMRNIGPLPLRLIVAFLYLGLPHIGEVWGKLTNSQWQMAVLSLLILIAAPPQGRLGTWFDRVALAIGALTGPFCILLLPIAALVAIYRRSSRTITQLAIVGLGAAVQAVALLLKGRPTETAKLGASFSLLGKLLVRWLFLGMLPSLARVPDFLRDIVGWWVFDACLAVGALAVLAWIFGKSGLEMRCVLLFGAIVTAASLASPKIVSWGEQWPTMLLGAGERYWFIPRLVLAVAVLWSAVQPFCKWARVAGAAALLAIFICCAEGWHIEQWNGIHFRTYAHVFNALPVGAQLRLPIDPPPSWTLSLTKKPLDRMSYDVAFMDGEILGVDDWRNRLHVELPDERSALLTGDVLWVNGASLGGRGSVMAPVHVAVRDGALLEGWAILATDAEFRPMDEMYAIVSSRVVKGNRLPLAGSYRKKRLDDAMYLLFLPSRVLGPGLQQVTLVGYSRSDNRLRTFGHRLYIYGD